HISVLPTTGRLSLRGRLRPSTRGGAMDTEGREAPGNGDVDKPWRPQLTLVAVFLVLIVAGVFLALRANAKVHNDHSPACRLVLATDDLFHLPQRTKPQVMSQLARWRTCDPGPDGVIHR